MYNISSCENEVLHNLTNSEALLYQKQILSEQWKPLLLRHLTHGVMICEEELLMSLRLWEVDII